MIATAFLTLTLTLGAPGSEEALLEGWVRTEDGAPVEEATVELEGTPRTVRSDEGGRFLLTAVSPPLVLIVRHPSFEVERVEVPAVSALDIRLQPRILVEEGVVVLGARERERFAPGSVTSSRIEPQQLAVPPATVAEAVDDLAGVSENGQGGLFQVVSIRGVSRGRVLNLFAGARLTSERRAGVSASFVDPSLIGEIAVVRGPASTHYGSGALGGAVQILPRSFSRLRVELGYDQAGDRLVESVGWGNPNFSLGLAHRGAGESRSPEGDALNDAFDQYSAVLRRRGGDAKKNLDGMLVVSYASDLGKSNTDFPERTTVYPLERHLLLRLADEHRDWWMRGYAHLHDLVTEVREGAGEERVENDTLDFGVLFERRVPVPGTAESWIGFDYFGRRNVNALERSSDPTRPGIQTLDGGQADEAALFGVSRWRWRSVSLEAGARGTWSRQANRDGSSPSRFDLTGFTSAAVALHRRLELAASLGSGLRVPSLSERFFSGTTGRGEVIGRPDLEAESSLSGEIGLRWLGDSLLLSGGVFRNEVDDYIERVELEPGLLTFLNLRSGILEGVELEGFAKLNDAVRLTFGAHRITGEDASGATLADLPPERLSTGVRMVSGRWSGGAEVSWRGQKEEVGSGEKAIPSAVLVDASIGYEVGRGLELRLRGRNLLDELYFPSADRKAAVAPGRSLGLSLLWRQP